MLPAVLTGTIYGVETSDGQATLLGTRGHLGGLRAPAVPVLLRAGGTALSTTCHGLGVIPCHLPRAGVLRWLFLIFTKGLSGSAQKFVVCRHRLLILNNLQLFRCSLLRIFPSPSFSAKLISAREGSEGSVLPRG